MFKELFTEAKRPKPKLKVVQKDINALVKETFPGYVDVTLKKSSAYPYGGILKVSCDTKDPKNIEASKKLDKLLHEEIGKSMHSSKGIIGVKDFDTHFYYLIESFNKEKY